MDRKKSSKPRKRFPKRSLDTPLYLNSQLPGKADLVTPSLHSRYISLTESSPLRHRKEARSSDLTKRWAMHEHEVFTPGKYRIPVQFNTSPSNSPDRSSSVPRKVRLSPEKPDPRRYLSRVDDIVKQAVPISEGLEKSLFKKARLKTREYFRRLYHEVSKP